MQLFIDLDGTIVDPSPRYYKLYLDLARSIGFEVLELDHYWRLKREKKPEQDILLQTTSDSEKITTYLVARKARIEEPQYLSLDSISQPTIGWLDNMSKNHNLYLVTMRRHRQFLLAQLESLKISSYFNEILNCDNNSGHWQVKKELIKSRLLSPASGWVIGDTEDDIESGRALGLKTAAITSGLRTEATLQCLSPTILIKQLADFSLDQSLS